MGDREEVAFHIPPFVWSLLIIHPEKRSMGERGEGRGRLKGRRVENNRDEERQRKCLLAVRAWVASRKYLKPQRLYFSALFICLFI